MINLPDCSWLLLLAWTVSAPAVEDGVYELTADGTPGARVLLPVTRGQFYASDNANDHWHGFVCYPQAGFLEGDRYGVVLADTLKRIAGSGRSGHSEYDFGLDLTASEVERAHALFGLPVHARHHPGHRIDGSFTTAKMVYEPHEKIVVTLAIRNLSDQPFRFQQGGHQRGPRDDQYHFTGQGPAGSMAIKPALNFGGMSAVTTIPPHGTWSMSVDLGGWMACDQPGPYTLMASYLLPIQEDDRNGMPIWEDYLTRPLSFTVRTPGAK